MSDIFPSRRNLAQCSTCAMRHLCMPEGLNARDIAKLEHVISVTRSVRRGEALYRAGTPFDSLFALRSGSIKTVVIREGGREQVTGLLLAGDALGLDGIGEGEHACDAIALEDSSVCVIPYALFERMCRETDTLQKRMLRMLGQAINREADHVLQLGLLRAEERVARLLLDLSMRLAKRGYATAEFTLRMTRDDIGSYLGMTLETVSRTLSRFDKLGLIEAKGKSIRINDFERLRSI
ncbi:helix-turn-helix domain-containing protein [Caballeronia sp. LP006]|jgi:CRP/FNR family transcriptional regulator|uniref:helix-turn-helix domain-containing protein n=1 Tax=unclassified Caballeronia TaxID=2646786 RepID=UPI001FD02ABB|nr:MULTISPECIES: helix-turn-helix domain-containing protein [unclassified Caballeronia]MDR5802297.1 helix-turn-helix domain-containing protein [Caballeronia sp. LZ001]MDR5828325.1 helix-turn-helix domain-containing protein [Caballeronia sp. LP006]